MQVPISTSFSSRSESFWVDVQIVTKCFGIGDDLLRCCLLVGLAGIRSRSTPGPLSGSEDAILSSCQRQPDTAKVIETHNHVQSIECRIDYEHDRVQHNLVSAQFRGEVDHDNPVQAERHGNEPNR
jgi:hypothetical protein